MVPLFPVSEGAGAIPNIVIILSRIATYYTIQIEGSKTNCSFFLIMVT